MNTLIEEYLRARGVRYFRGQHDDEYFFLVDFQADFCLDTSHGRLHVHLEVSGLLRDNVLLSITPDRFYPVGKRDLLTSLSTRWTAGSGGAEAVVHDSSDPALVGITVLDRFRPTSSAGLAYFVDQSIASAIELFEQVTAEVLPSHPGHEALRDAG
jgi:hypothetical protein